MASEADARTSVEAPGTATRGSRPYRSHRYPACDFCRRRKTRCTRDVDDQPCQHCQRHGRDCTWGDSRGDGNEARSPRRDRQPRQVWRTQRARYTPEAPALEDICLNEPRQRPGGNLGTTAGQEDISLSENAGEAGSQRPIQTQSGHIIGPASARDVQILEQYLPVSHARPNPYSVYSSDTRNPIVYLKVPRQRVRTSRGNGSAGFRQYESIEKVLEPHGGDVVELYFQAFHPAFPILDEKTVREAYRKKALPNVLVCEIYAVSIISWPTSAKLGKARPHPPDIRFIWSQTVEALNEEFLAPAFSTVTSCILDLTGRPTTSMTYNAINIGRAVALSQSLGLNRDPSSWDLGEDQKALRVRTSWGVLIHDWWASLAHGTPPHTHPMQFDVEVPDLNLLLIGGMDTDDDATDSSGPRTAGAHSFRALCRLTEILGDILPLIYNTKRRKGETEVRSLRRIEASLDEWEESLPQWLNPSSLEFQRTRPGALNLQLSFLAIKMCICRVSLLESVKSDEYNNRETWQYLHLQCRRAAKSVVGFALSLQGRDLHAFWLPYTAYHFASAAILILRCALEAVDDDVAEDSISAARALVEHLRWAKAEAQWDLADVCLSQCESLVYQLSDKAYLVRQRQRNRDGDGDVARSRSERLGRGKPAGPGIPRSPLVGQQVSADMTTAPDPAPDHILAGPTDLRMDIATAVAHGAETPTGGSWEVFPQLTIADLWDASGFSDYSEFTA